MASKAISGSLVRTVHVEDRTPGAAGMAPMVTLEDGVQSLTDYAGSHHRAVYLAAIITLSNALQDGERRLTTPSEHLVEQVDGRWDVGEHLRPYFDVVKILEAQFVEVSWGIAPRTTL